MSTLVRSRRSFGSRTRTGAQRGVALVVALILLVVATLIGLAASRGTFLQERMSSNSYDRSLAFQRSESALRFAEEAITSEWRINLLNGEDCSVVACALIPTNAFTGTSAPWRNVTTDYDVNDAKTPGTPQYYIQLMGTGRADNVLGTRENADTGNYGSGAAPDNVAFYRVTARSSDPADVAGRAIVVLQATFKRPY
jgi:type IV pilus assembly protein PilX